MMQPQLPAVTNGEGEGAQTHTPTIEERRDEEITAAAAATPAQELVFSNNGAAISSSQSQSHGEVQPKQHIFRLQDANGNAVNISRRELQNALSYPEETSSHNDNNDYDEEPMYTYSSDGMLDDQRHDEANNNNNFSIRGTNTSQRAFLDEVKRFELFRSVIQHEDDLLNQRVSWIILAQSFLMAAFITNTSDNGSGDALKYITACVGLATCLVTMPAIFSAGRNIELQQQVYFARISSEERCRELHGHGRNILKICPPSDKMTRRRRGGDRNAINLKEEHKVRLSHGHIFPNMAFRGRGSVPILFTVVALAIVQVGGWLFLLIALAKGW